MSIDPFLIQATGFSSAAALLILGSAWWLFRSPIQGRSETTVTTRPKPAVAIASALGFAVALQVVGALWDASKHIQTGRIPSGADFLWAPHIAIYSGFLISLLVAATAIAMVAIPAARAGVTDPRRWVRQNPYLGAVALASLYELLAIPGDAIWHELFGVDLTAWSPPHLLLAATIAVVVICGIGLLVQARPAFAHPGRIDLMMQVLFALMLNMLFLVGTLEWELPTRSPLVAARPLWLYPAVGGALGLFALALARRLTLYRWAATATAVFFYLIRGAITIGLYWTGNVTPALPLVMVLGAICIDLLVTTQANPGPIKEAVHALAFTAGYLALSIPSLITRLDFGFPDIAMAFLVTLTACLILVPAARYTARLFTGVDDKPE